MTLLVRQQILLLLDNFHINSNGWVIQSATWLRPLLFSLTYCHRICPTSNYQLQFTHDLDRCLQWLVRSSCRQFGRPSSCTSGLMTVIIRGHRVWNTQALIWGIHGHKKKAAITTFVNNLRGDHLRYLDHAGCRFKPCWNVFAVV